MTKLPFRASACALAFTIGFPAHAQEHMQHGGDMPVHHDDMAGADMPPPDDNTSSDNAPAMQTAMDHSMMMRDGFINAPSEGSGTSRLPALEGGHHGLHIPAGKWMLMLHGYANAVHTDQSGPRGASKDYAQSMAMLTVERKYGGARVQFKSMFSLEPLMSHRGYPNLFATGETANGAPLIDRQHPHDLFMELAARVDVELDETGTQAFIYGGPVGEPALGPSAFMHRASARYNPEAPITHHWFDSTHITYGVVTAGLKRPLWQIEASGFRGREPDEYRWNIEKPRLDSWSVRATLTPSPKWAAHVSYGHLKDPEELHPGEDEGRTTASAHYNDGKGLSAMAAFSAKNRLPGPVLTAWLGEVNWDISSHHTIFGRFESVENDELFPDHDDPLNDIAFRVSKFQAGYAYRLPISGPVNVALGGTLSAFAKPKRLDEAYGKHPMGFTLFARFALGL